MSSTLLTARGITKRFGTKTVLNGVSFSVREGEVLGLIGPNGAGKTTLFECMSGLLPRDGGAIEGAGDLFYLPDAIRPWPDQTVDWALRFFEGVFGYKTSRQESRLAATSGRPTLIEVLGLKAVTASRIGSLSKGECKRFLLALGLLTPQPLLLLDEPFDGLDFRQTRDVMELLRGVRGRTLFLSIHQLIDAARVCDRFVLLSGGHVVGEGTLDELRARAGVEGGLEEIFLALT